MIATMVREIIAFRAVELPMLIRDIRVVRPRAIRMALIGRAHFGAI